MLDSVGVRLTIRSLWAEGEASFSYAFDQNRILLGRSSGADVCIPHTAISVTHATITAQQAHYVITDLDSTNGTKVNGERLAPHRAKRLQNGDQIECGGFEIAFSAGIAVSSPTSEVGTVTLARKMVEAALSRESKDVAVPELRVVAGPEEGRVLALPSPPARLTVGRAEDSDLFLTDPDVSRHHIEIHADVDGYDAKDLNSKNGMTLAGRPVAARRLRHGDTLQIGCTVLVFCDPVDTAMRELFEAPDQQVDVPTRTLSVSKEKTTEHALDNPTDPNPTDLAPEHQGTSQRAKGSTAKRSHYSLDLMIYVLAGAVLALSVAGLIALLRS